MNLTLSIHFFFTDEMNFETNPRSDSIETSLLEEGGGMPSTRRPVCAVE